MGRPDANAEGAVPAVLSWRSLALPNEHGGWGLLIEPALLGLVLAPSVAGAGVALAALLAFLARHPLRLALSDRLRGRSYPRTALAARIAVAYLAGAAVAFAVAVWRAPLLAFAPLVAAAPLGLVQLVYDARLRSRELLPELLGGVALGAPAPMILLASGWPLLAALSLWGVLAARVLGSVLYVRARLRLARGTPASVFPVLAVHALGLVALSVPAFFGFVTWMAPLSLVLLLGRAAWGLRRGAPAQPPRVIGFQEMGWGALTVALLVAGSWTRA
jgi:hypothetical protein